MSEDGLHPLETILHLCAAAAPEPWYPRLFAKQEGVDPQALGRCLEDLWLSGLIDRADGGSEKGPAITLTREGQRVLLDPEALQRLRAGKPISSNDRAAVIREALRGRLRPFITHLLFALNILIFVVGYYSARKLGVGSAFLGGEPAAPMVAVLDQSGALTPEHVVEGQWRRLLTTGFVHIGFLHLLMNMSCLFIAGRFIEQMWGHFRYLVIYVVSILGGSSLGIAHNVTRLAGASGAICGLLAAEAVWFLFNRRYLPRALLRQARTVFIVNFVLLIFISSFKNVSAWGHFGGAVAGALAAMLLQLHRFGPPLWRWLAVIGFVPLVWYGQYAIEYARATDPKWQEVERRVLEEHFAEPVASVMGEAKKVYKERALPLLEKHPTRREESEVEPVLAALTEQRETLQAIDDELARFGPLLSLGGEHKKQSYLDRIARRLEWINSAEEALRNGSKWSQEEHEQQDFETRFLRVTDSTLSEAMAIYRERIRPVIEMDPAQRAAAAIKDAQAALADQRPRLLDLGEELRDAGPYEDETVETARLIAVRYANAGTELFDFCRQNLNSGAKETDSRKQALDKGEKKVEVYHQKWRDLVE
ncbi:MAG TPA: rhomboid family intramembrane serine protease [Gemmataceae bacterium]|nr:rhomboid family intramembrane serine protease [Gemmataceae bacterium]